MAGVRSYLLTPQGSIDLHLLSPCQNRRQETWLVSGPPPKIMADKKVLTPGERSDRLARPVTVLKLAAGVLVPLPINDIVFSNWPSVLGAGTTAFLKRLNHKTQVFFLEVALACSKPVFSYDHPSLSKCLLFLPPVYTASLTVSASRSRHLF